MSPMPRDYYYLPAGPAAKYCGVDPKTITHFRVTGQFQNHYQYEGFWLYRFQDLDHLKEAMQKHENPDHDQPALIDDEDKQEDPHVHVMFTNGDRLKIWAVTFKQRGGMVNFFASDGSRSATIPIDRIQYISEAE